MGAGSAAGAGWSAVARGRVVTGVTYAVLAVAMATAGSDVALILFMVAAVIECLRATVLSILGNGGGAR